MTRNGVEVNFSYINGIPATISYDGMTFYYVVNGQGDITGIVDNTGKVQLRYYYDAWGVSTSVYSDDATYGLTLATINPLRYRGYVYDWEVGLYYLQSRYYIPQIARFLNADGLVSTGQGLLGNNMFAYCGNNPVSRYDPSGCDFEDLAQRIKKIVIKIRIMITELASSLLYATNRTTTTIIHHSNEMDVCTDGKFCNDDLNSASKPYGDTGLYLNENQNFYEHYNSGVTCTVYSCVDKERILYGFLACDSLLDANSRKNKGNNIYDYNVANMMMSTAHIIALFLSEFLNIWNQYYVQHDSNKGNGKAQPEAEKTSRNLCNIMMENVKSTRYGG